MMALWAWLASRRIGQLVSGGLAVAFAVLSIYTFSLRHEIDTTNLAHDKEIIVITAKLNQTTLERDEYKRSFESLKADLAEASKHNAEAYAQARKQNAEALARLRNQQLQSDSNQVKQLQVIQNQDAVCKAALESLDIYCKGVGEL